jgi:hypothetical protein
MKVHLLIFFLITPAVNLGVTLSFLFQFVPIHFPENNVFTFSSKVVAQVTSNINDRPIEFSPRLSAKDDDPPRTESGNKFGSDICDSEATPLTSLVPNQDGKSFIIQTAQSHPSFWFYLPYNFRGSSIVSEFYLNKTVQERIYKGRYLLPENSGVIVVSLSADIPPLEIGETYLWTFTVICDPEDRSSDRTVHGKIQRVNPTPNLIPSQTSTLEESARLYASDGLWPETLMSLTEQINHANSETVNSDLEHLLNSMGFGDIPFTQPLQLVPIED